MAAVKKTIVWFDAVTREGVPAVSEKAIKVLGAMGVSPVLVSPDMIDVTREIIAQTEARLKIE